MDEPVRVFYVDDDANYRKLVVRLLGGKENGFHVTETDSLQDFQKYLLQDDFDVVMTDLDVRWDTGLQVIDFVQAWQPSIPVIVVTNSRSEELAVEAMKRGAADYIFKNSQHFKVLPATIRSVIKNRKLDEVQRQSGQALKTSEENYRKIFDNCFDGILFTAPDGRIFNANHAACKMLGRTVEEICELGRDAVVDKTDARLFDALEKRYREGEFKGELNYKRKDASVFPVELTSKIFKDGDGETRTVTVFRDLSDLRQVEKDREAVLMQSFHAQKMEAIGTLVVGIAHDFNNMLQIILSASQLLMIERKDNDRDFADLQQIVKTVHDGADLVNQLLLFAKKGGIRKVSTKLNDVILSMGDELFDTFPKAIRVELDLDPDPATVFLDPNLALRILVNASVNAKEAMPDGGLLKITTNKVSLDSDYCRTHLGITPGDFAMLSIADTGCGMDERTLSKIFEPFFSTKDMSSAKGTGLGLSIVQGIVEQHNGHITCESKLGIGTELKIYFPVI